MRVLLLTLPQHGHVNPTLPFIRKMIKNNFEVSCINTEEFREKVENSGAKFISVGISLDIYEEASKLLKGSGTLQFVNALSVFMKVSAEMLQQLDQILALAKLEAPDFVVYDPMCLWGHAIADILKKPKATFYTTYASQKGDNFSKQMLAELQLFKAYALFGPLLNVFFQLIKLKFKYHLNNIEVSNLFSAQEELNIVAIPKQIQLDAERFDDSYYFIGPSIIESSVVCTFPIERLTGEKVLFISMGSTPMNTQTDFFRNCFKAFANTDWQVVIAVGQTDIHEFGVIPTNFIVQSYVPQLKILERAKLFISHGGMNSVMECLNFGVPLIIIPMQPETKITGKQVEKLRLGKWIEPHSVSVDTLIDAVEEIVKNPIYISNLVTMRHAIQSGGDYSKVIEKMFLMIENNGVNNAN